MKRLLLVLVAASGLAAGWFGRALVDPSRADRMLAMFREYCIRNVREGKPIQPGPSLRRLQIEVGREQWADPQSRLVLAFGSRDCNISDMLDPLSEAQVIKVEQITRIAIAEDFPQLRIDDSNVLGGRSSSFSGTMTIPRFHQEDGP